METGRSQGNIKFKVFKMLLILPALRIVQLVLC